jgi:hypothetical protein
MNSARRAGSSEIHIPCCAEAKSFGSARYKIVDKKYGYPPDGLDMSALAAVRVQCTNVRGAPARQVLCDRAPAPPARTSVLAKRPSSHDRGASSVSELAQLFDAVNAGERSAIDRMMAVMCQDLHSSRTVD